MASQLLTLRAAIPARSASNASRTLTLPAYARAVYDKSAQIYDLLYTGSGIKDYVAEAVELHRIIDQACPAARTLLDVACGTGAHLAELRQWYSVEGVDLSPAMLAIARRKLPAIALHVADMRTFDLGRSFDAVICLFSSIGHVTNPLEMRLGTQLVLSQRSNRSR